MPRIQRNASRMPLLAGLVLLLGFLHLPAALGQSIAPAEIVQVPFGFVGGYVIVRGDEVAVVDTGPGGNGEQIGEAIAAFGLGWENVRHLILTHSHSDHTGSVEEVLAMAPQAELWAGAPDIPALSFSRPVQPLFDGDEIFALLVVATPGHTLGHISLLDREGLVLIAGSVAGSRDGQVVPPRADDPFAASTADLALAYESIKKLAELSFERALFNHAGPIDSGASEAFKAAAATLP